MVWKAIRFVTPESLDVKLTRTFIKTIAASLMRVAECVLLGYSDEAKAYRLQKKDKTISL